MDKECPECKSNNIVIEKWFDEYETFECKDCGYYIETDIDEDCE